MLISGHVLSTWAAESHVSEVWWCLWREEALGRAAPLGPPGRLWLWLRQVIWLDLRRCPLSRTWGTSCGRNGGVKRLTLHPFVCLHLSLSLCNYLCHISMLKLVVIFLLLPARQCLVGVSGFQAMLGKIWGIITAGNFFNPDVATTKINTSFTDPSIADPYLSPFTEGVEVMNSYRTELLDLVEKQCLLKNTLAWRFESALLVQAAENQLKSQISLAPL